MSDQKFGAVPVDGGVKFRVWAPSVSRLSLILNGSAAGTQDMSRDADGVFEAFVVGARAGAPYPSRLDNGDVRPDPASRFQPEGVHGPSEVVDASAFGWTDDRWHGRPA